MSNQIIPCNHCGKESYIEHSADINGPYMRLPGVIDMTRNVTENAGPTACNEKTGFAEQESCAGTSNVNWSITGEECVSDPICSHINKGDCCYFRLIHFVLDAPFDSFRRWEFQGRVGALTNVSYNKSTTLGWNYNLSVQGIESKPRSF